MRGSSDADFVHAQITIVDEDVELGSEFAGTGRLQLEGQMPLAVSWDCLGLVELRTEAAVVSSGEFRADDAHRLVREIANAKCQRMCLTGGQ